MPHTFTNLMVHIVFSTRRREPIIDETFRDRLWAYMGGLAKEELGLARIAGGTDDHIHGLLSLRPDVSVSKAMERWKSLATVWVKKTIPEASDFGWQRGYSAFSVSQSQVDKVVAYIARQTEHHHVMTFEEEFAKLLEAHGIELPGASA